MSDRTDILNRVRAARPEAVECPDPTAEFGSDSEIDRSRLITAWSEHVRSAGGVVHAVPDAGHVKEWVRARTWSGPLVSTVQGLNDDPFLPDIPTTTDAMDKTDLLLVESTLAVAENGAVWMSDETGVPRALPFLCREMAVILPASRIVSTMHEAYRKIGSKPVGWGLFIGAPSKTADIEQSLVVGAHGPEALTLFLLDK
ncbi:MAG: LUD domain-containing protein [Balneolaceae bacterium]